MIQIIGAVDENIKLISLTSEKLEVVVSNYGCTIVKVLMPDQNGHRDDVVLGYDDWSLYQNSDGYLGALVGRVANRIKNGQLTLNGKNYQLAINNGPNHLHGGIKGLSYRIFDFFIHEDCQTVEFHYISPDGEEGYPGELDLKVFYTLQDDTLTIRYQAVSSQDTIINLTNHSYFNLSGHQEDIKNHELCIHAQKFACIDSDGLVDGKIREVAHTPFDFRTPKLIGEQLSQQDEQLILGHGFDHPFLFDTDTKQVILTHQPTQRQLIVSTTLPQAQIYTANYLDGRLGKYGHHYYAQDAICIETQNMPDAIHVEDDPSTILRKGQLYDETTSYQFKVIK